MTLYWVGGTSTWNSTAGTKWATSSGGAGGAAVPTAADDVVFDGIPAGGGAAVAQTITLSSSSVCRSIDVTSSVVTISHPAATTLTIGDATAGTGNRALRFVSGMTYAPGANTCAISFVSISATQQDIDFAGKNTGNVSFGGASGGSWRLTGTWGTSSVLTSMLVTLTRGTLDTNGQTCNWGAFNSSHSNTRTLTLGSSAVNCFGATNGSSWQCSTSTNMTLNAGTSHITMSSSGANFMGSSLTYYDLSFTGISCPVLNAFTGSARNITRTTSAGLGRALQTSASFTVTGVFTLTGNSTTNRMLFCSNDFDGARVISLGTTGTVVAQYCDFINITFTGTNTPFTGTSLGDAGGNTGITFDAPVTRYWVGNGGSWSDTSHWSTFSGGAGGASVPLIHDTVIFDNNSITSAGQTITQDIERVNSLDFSNVLNSPTYANSATNNFPFSIVFGDVVFSSGMTTSGSGNIIIRGGNQGNSDCNLTTNGVSVSQSIRAALKSGRTMTITDNLTCASQLGFGTGSGGMAGGGTLIVNNVNITIASFTCDSSANKTRVINMGSGTWTLTGTGTVWNAANATGLTINAQTSTIVISDTSATSKTFAGLSLTYNNLTVTGGGSGAILFTNTAVFNVLTFNAPKTITFSSGQTRFFNRLIAVGSSGNVITFQSGTPGSTYTMTCTADAVISCDWLSIRDSIATGATFYAGANSTNVSGNTGWVFTAGASTSTLTESALSLTETLKRDTVAFKSDSVSFVESLKRDTAKFITEYSPSGLTFDGTQNYLNLSVANWFSQLGSKGIYGKIIIKASTPPITLLYGKKVTPNSNLTLSAAYNGTYGQNCVSLGMGDTQPAGRSVDLVKDIFDGKPHTITFYYLSFGANGNYLNLQVDDNSDGSVNGANGPLITGNDFTDFRLGFDPTGGAGRQSFECKYLMLGTYENVYTTGVPTKVAEWSFTSPNYLTDLTGNGNTATLAGSPLPTYSLGYFEFFNKATSLFKTESPITFAETLIKGVSSVISTSISLTESIIKSVARTITDNSLSGLRFDGTQNYINLGTLGSLGSNAGSGLYVKFDIITTQTTPFGFGEYNLFTESLYITLNLNASEVTSNHALNLVFEGNNNNFFVAGVNSPTISFNDGFRHTLEFELLPASGSLVVRIDGVPQTVTVTRHDGGYTYGNFASDFYMGARNNNGSPISFMNATIDNFAIGTSANNIFANYKFDEGSGTTTADATGNGNTATLSGSPVPTWVVYGTESLLKAVTKTISETLSLTEIITKITNYFMTITESVTLTEIFSRNFTKLFTDAISFIENIRTVKNPYNFRKIIVSYEFTKLKVTSLINRIKVRVDR